jgi:hypothetical protein
MCRHRERLVIVTLGALLSIAACAIITVNVYFPEKDVKAAYKDLEDELLQQAPEKPGPTTAPKPSSGLDRRSLLAAGGSWRVALVAEALAQDDLSGKIADEIRKDPDVVAAYKRLGQKLGRLNELRDKGLVGEGKDGKVAVRGQLGDADKKLVQEVNADRDMVINGMAKAILKLAKQDATAANMSNAKKQAAESFASLRRDKAKSGWPIQLPDGTWKTK